MKALLKTLLWYKKVGVREPIDSQGSSNLEVLLVFSNELGFPTQEIWWRLNSEYQNGRANTEMLYSM